MDGHVDPSLMSERLEELMELQRGISFDKNLEAVGSTTTALVDRLLDDDPDVGAVARTPAQALDVDGVTNLRSAEGLAPGELVRVRVVDALDYDLIAEPVSAAANDGGAKR